MGVNASRNQAEVDEDYRQAAHLAALAAPYRHARLSAVKVASDPNKDDATADDCGVVGGWGNRLDGSAAAEASNNELANQGRLIGASSATAFSTIIVVMPLWSRRGALPDCIDI
jgi:hypothetical protein